MPQLMPLYWIMSIFMFLLIYMSMCNIYSTSTSMKWVSVKMVSNKSLVWLW